MKFKTLFPLFSLLVLFAFGACKDDEEANSSYLDLSKQVLTLTEGEVTTSTFSFSVKASDANIPYLCLYVDKNTVDHVSKGELPAYLMDDLKKQAEDKGTPFEQYVASISLKGDQSVKIENLLPGRIYELVAFAVDGTRMAEEAEYLFFQTDIAESVDCSFDIQATATSNAAEFIVKPSNKEVDYYFCTFPKATYQQAADMGWDDLQILNAYFSEEMNYRVSQLAPDGRVTPEVVDQLLQQLFHRGDLTLTASGLQSKTEYVWMAAAFKTVEVDGALTFVIVSEPQKNVYTTKEGDTSMIDMKFDIQVTDVTATSAKIKVVPENLEQTYIWCYDPYDETTKNMTPMQIAEQFVRSQGPFVGFVVKSGIQEAPAATLTPGVKHYVLAFAYNVGTGIVSEPQCYEFNAAPSDGDPSQMTFTYSINSLSPYQVDFNILPSDETLPYTSLLMPDEDYNEAKAKASIEEEVKLAYQESLRFDPEKPMSTFLYESYYRPGSRYGNVYKNLVPGRSYTLSYFALDNEGKVARVQADKSFITAPQFSDAQIKGECLGYFDGDKEAGKIFGDSAATAGRAIVVMRFEPSENTQDPKYIFVDKIYEQMSDIELYTSFNWTSISAEQHYYAYVLSDWNASYSCFMSVKDDKGIDSKVERLSIGQLIQSKAGSIDELKKIIEGANADTKALKLPNRKIDTPAERAGGEQAQVPYRPSEVRQTVVGQPMKFGREFYLPVARPVKK